MEIQGLGQGWSRQDVPYYRDNPDPCDPPKIANTGSEIAAMFHSSSSNQREQSMKNDTAVFHAFKNGVWMGMGTREAIRRRGLESDGLVLWCPHEFLVDGWRGR